MSLTPSTMLELGTPAPDFLLPGTKGEKSLESFKDKKVLVLMFICNHCPYVQHIRKGLIQLVMDYHTKNVVFVAINANDTLNYPEDSYEKMVEDAKKFGYPFDYLYDETQKTAQAYRAACTPDFFVFGQDRKLVYRGQMDDSRPGKSEPVSGNDLRTAINAVLEDKEIPGEQKPSTGCNIKWRLNNKPDYFRG